MRKSIILNTPQVNRLQETGTLVVVDMVKPPPELVDRVLYDLPPSPHNDFQGNWDSGYRDYECEEEAPNAEYPYVRKSTESILSLIRANFTDHAKKHLILKKNS